MNKPFPRLSEICESAIVVDLERNEVWPYRTVLLETERYLPRPNPPMYTYLIYWPGGLVSYVACEYKLEQLSPSFIESVHASAKFLKPAVPWKRRR